MYAITGASGQLGRLAIESLIERVGAGAVVALARDPKALDDLAARGVTVRRFDYDDAVSLVAGLAGVERLLLVSSNAVGRRAEQHGAVIRAARDAGVGYIAYTSILHADRNPMALAVEHRATEQALRDSGIPHALLRNGWYLENHLGAVAAALAQGVVIGGAGDGRISGAARADYAEAAAAVLADGGTQTRILELAGDTGFTLADFARTLGGLAGKSIRYENMTEAGYRAALEAAGLPAPWPEVLAESDAKAAAGSLFDDSRALSALIGRPTTPLGDVLAKTLAA